jgi:uncharacterized protein YegL
MDLTPNAMPRRTVVIFFLIDTSGSMYGNKIGSVNSSMEEILPESSGGEEDEK